MGQTTLHVSITRVGSWGASFFFSRRQSGLVSGYGVQGKEAKTGSSGQGSKGCVCGPMGGDLSPNAAETVKALAPRR